MRVTAQHLKGLSPLRWSMAPAAIALVLLMVHTLANAVMRTWGRPLEGTLEYGAYWYMPFIAIVGFSIAQRRGEQIEATIIFDKLSPRAKREAEILAYAFMLALSLGCLWFGWLEAQHAASIERSLGISGVPIWQIMFIVPIGFGLLACQLVADAWRTIRTPLQVASVRSTDVDNSLSEGAVL